PPPRQRKRDVPPALEAVCLKAMAQQPEDRYATVQALAADIEHWLADEPVTAYQEPWQERLRRWGRRHRPLVTAAMTLLLTAVVALASGLWVVEKERQHTAQERDDKERALQAANAAREQTMTALRSLTNDLVEQQLGRHVHLTPEDKAFVRQIL